MVEQSKERADYGSIPLQKIKGRSAPVRFRAILQRWNAESCCAIVTSATAANWGLQFRLHEPHTAGTDPSTPLGDTAVYDKLDAKLRDLRVLPSVIALNAARFPQCYCPLKICVREHVCREYIGLR